ncbi:MAG: SIMPL domain-containing protein [Methyloceanibacter sp.]|jgi:uncharacterized protein|nr:SIMPL domain-containing protein [Methyloceanibacter sp.]
MDPMSSKYLLALLLSMAALVPSATAHDQPEKRNISLVASGIVKTTPDMVDISTGVTSEAPSARAALDKNTEAMTKVVEALKEEGIDPKDIQTANFSVGPIYEQKAEGKPPVVTGYRVTNQVRITLHDTGKLGAVLDKVVSLGANQIDSIEFGVEEPEALKDEARKLALKNVTDNAKLYAEAAGVGLGQILTISEEESSYQPRYAQAARAMEMAKDVPIEAGTASVEVRVRVTWELD